MAVDSQKSCAERKRTMAYYSSSSGKNSTQDRLLSAAFRGDLELLKKLAEELNNGGGIAKVLKEVGDSGGKGALHYAVAGEGKTLICKYLVEELKLDVNVQDETGETPLIGSTLDGDYAISAYLLKHGADPNVTNDKGFTPLHLAAKKGRTDLMQLFIVKGAKVDAEAVIGTPLQGAAAHGVKDSVEFLLKNQANPNLACSSASPPLICAIYAKSVDCVRVMLELGADPNISSCGLTPLAVATSEGETEIITCLLNAGADPNAPNFYDIPPIETAAMNNNIMDVMVLFPATTPIACVPDWSIRGVVEYFDSAEAESKRKFKIENKRLEAKERGAEAFKKGHYMKAIYWYTEAMSGKPTDAALLSNSSLCWARLNEGERALADAMACISMREDWPKAHYRAGVAWQLLRDYKSAADEFHKALKLDPNNKELQDAYR
ncbi:hypothetical protein Cgig2_015334 [Carnegiea gigantea]|uniref:Uncharacterized protein n=1 Tax=Carnegiea gigantea TaxID=171969 RepID=A0A9Q1GRP2_9CARY|nr:hypothetical protein Cgig2_015334 [Carnegiea gigantea]